MNENRVTHRPRIESQRRVWITGLGVVSPVGVGRVDFWSGIVGGKSGTTALESLPHGIPEELQSRVVAQVHEVSDVPDDYPGDRNAWLARLAAVEAASDAGLYPSRLRASRHGIDGLAVGTAVGATAAMETSFLAMDREGEFDLAAGPGSLWSQVTFDDIQHDLSALFGLKENAYTISTGCTSGIDAIGHGFEMVRDGWARTALVGASDAPITPIVFAVFDVIGALSRRNDEPQSASRPFDRDRDGFVLGEGAAFLILEERDHAISRGATPYAEIGGFASMSNGYHMTDLPPDGAVLSECFERALDDSGLRPDEIDHVSAHGSSTPQNDICETNAIKSVLGVRSDEVTVNSLKSMVGHALGASNAIEIAACALSLRHQVHHPTINLSRPGEGCDLDYVPNAARRARIRNIAKLSNGFSGIHSTMVLSESS